MKTGRPPTITLKIEKKELSLNHNSVKQLLKSKVKGFAKSGAYIPISQEYKDHSVFVVVMEKE